MKNVLVIAFLSFSVLASGRIFYVQDPAYNENASDTNPGNNIEYPWATWQRAFDSARPGDTVYFRGGTWYPTTELYGSVVTYNPRGGHGYNGT